MKARSFELAVPRGYYNAAEPWVKDQYDAHPEHKATIEKPVYAMSWYAPKGWDSEKGKWEDALKADPNLIEAYPYWDDFVIECTESQYLDLLSSGARPTVSACRTFEVGDVAGSVGTVFVEQMLALNQKVIDQLQRASSEFFNERCGQLQPTSKLHSVNCLMLMEDACTDALQGYLDEGWSILAIQPQPDQRRPDYILGKYDPEHRKSGRGAERG